MMASEFHPFFHNKDMVFMEVSSTVLHKSHPDFLSDLAGIFFPSFLLYINTADFSSIYKTKSKVIYRGDYWGSQGNFTFAHGENFTKKQG